MKIDENQLYTTQEVAKLLKVSDITVKRYIADKKILSLKFNGIRRIKGDDIIKLFKNNKDIIVEEKKAGFYREDAEKYLNSVYQGDIMELLKKLPDNSVDMVFGDPDYNVGINYGDKNYTRDFDEYMNWYIELTRESMRVLKEDGNLFMMNYPKQNAHLRVKYLDDNFPLVFDNVWVYNSNVGHTPKRFTTAHRSILHVRKIENNKFYKENVALPYKNPNDKRILNNLKNGSKGRMPYSWYYFNLVKNVSKEKTFHACQIPQQLTEMLIKAATMPNDTVLVLFGGSGAELEVCNKLNRKFIAAEIDPKYQEIIKDRLENGIIQEKYRLPAYLKLRNRNTQMQRALI
ncbi:helix-turn-helix domain-containing protein [Patescibacteria group bacterium]|nr:helix-turn-helix domain-containing protein [Patescibacteria group bacterium]